MVWEERSFEEFQDGSHGHLGYLNGRILAILNLCHCDAPIKFWLNPTYGLEGDVILRITRIIRYRNGTT